MAAPRKYPDELRERAVRMAGSGGRRELHPPAPTEPVMLIFT